MLTEVKTRNRVIGVLLVILAILGIIILSLDKFIWIAATNDRAYPLIAFVAIDLVLASLLFSRRLKSIHILPWAVARLILNLADIATAPIWYKGQPAYVDFASYLFNPLDTQGTGVGNPRGIPSVPLDLMVIIYLAIIVLSLISRRQAQKTTPVS